MSVSATTIVESELPPRIIPEYTPNSMTCRPSTAAARASTWAASCTPCPPMPVRSTSRSMRAPREAEEVMAQSADRELHRVLHIAASRALALQHERVHTSHGQLVHGLRVAFRICGGNVGQRGAQRLLQPFVGALHLVAEL